MGSQRRAAGRFPFEHTGLVVAVVFQVGAHAGSQSNADDFELAVWMTHDRSHLPAVKRGAARR
jgi:hypothetical protein